MLYALDTEFIDTPTCSALISFALVAEDGRELYLEFTYPEEELTPWLRENVVPHLNNNHFVSPGVAAKKIAEFIGSDVPEFWCYFGAYDWYWLCRVFGGMMNLPPKWPQLFREAAWFREGKPKAVVQHNALSDAKALMSTLRLAA